MNSIRECKMCKAFFGMLGAMGMAVAIVVFVRDTPPDGGAPYSLRMGFSALFFGIGGLIIFVVSDYYQRVLEGRNVSGYFRSAAITFSVMVSLIGVLVWLAHD